jgi:hypothetical protein
MVLQLRQHSWNYYWNIDLVMIRWSRDVLELKFNRHLMVADLNVEKTTLN